MATYFTLLVKTRGGRVMILVSGSSSSSYMDCIVFFGVECLLFRRSGVRITPCSYICTSVVGLIIFESSFCGSHTFRMSTRRLPVILFVSRIEYPYPVVCCAECLWGPVGAFTLYASYSMSVISLINSLLILLLLRPPPWALRKPHRTRLLLRFIQSAVIVLTFAIFIQ